MRIKKFLWKTVALVTTAVMLTGYESVLDTEASEYESDTEEISTESTEKNTSASLMTTDFFNSGDYEYEILDDGTIEITGYTGSDVEIEIPSTIDGYTVTSIVVAAFEDCESIEVPDSVVDIGYFPGSYTDTNLKSINVDSNNLYYTSVDGVLYNKDMTTIIYCPGAKTGSFVIPDGVTSIGYGAFDGCSGLTSITIPDSVTSTCDSSFFGCVSLKSIEVDSGNESYVSYEGVLYNYDMTELVCCPGGKTSISIPNSVTSIGRWSFAECSSLTSITIPDSVTSIGYGAFDGCSGLTSITIPDSVTSIDEDAFAGCSSLTSIKLPNSITEIETYMFSMCSSLTSITIPDDVTSIGVMAFFGCSSLTSITIPNGVTSIGESAFDSCSGLTSITIPDGVTSIDYCTFGFCDNLTSIVIPESVTNIGEWAFGYCKKLSDIYYTGSETQWKSITFDDEWNYNCSDDMVIHYNYTGVSEQTITASAASSTITGVGNTTTITASTTGDGAITYLSSDTSVATVDSTGKVTAKGYGTATITVTAAATDSFSAATKTLTINVKHATPTLKSATNTTSGVKVTWGAVTGATKYQVYRKTSGGSWAKLGTSTSTSYTDKTAKSGTTYYYTVCCMNSSGTYTSDYNTSGISKKYLSKGKISSLTNKSGGITIKWSKVTGASGYYIYRKTSSGSYSKIKTITSGSTLSYTDTKVKSKNGTTYVYKVVPYSGSTTGSFTAKTTVRLTGTTLSSVKNSSSKKMTVKWSKKSSITGYQIQYSTSSSFSSYKTLNVSGASKVSKVISSLTKNKTYYVRIRTYKTVNETKYYSAWSSKKSVKIKK